MLNDKGKIQFFGIENFVLVGIFLSLLFWLVEAVIHTYVFGEPDFAKQIIPSDSNEFWMRFQVSSLLISFSIYAQAVISRRDRAEEALKASEEKYRRIIETAGEGIWMIDAESRTVFVNNETAEMLGYATYEMMGKTLFHFMDAEARQSAEFYLMRRREGIKEQHDFRFKRKDGADLWVIISTNPILDPEGRYAGALGMINDVTERKRVEERLHESEERFRLIAENSTDLICVLDNEGRFTYASPSCSALLGYKNEEFLNMKAREVIHPEDMKRVAGRQNSPISEFRVRKAGGEWIWLEGSSYIINLHGKKFAVGIARDITERRRMDEALRSRLDELERFRRATVERELRMKELKDMIAELEAEAGKRMQKAQKSRRVNPLQAERQAHE